MHQVFQRVVAKCADQTADISIYEKNKDLLYNGLILLIYGFFHKRSIILIGRNLLRIEV